MTSSHGVMRSRDTMNANEPDSWWVVETVVGGPHEGEYLRWVASTSTARRAHAIAASLDESGGL